MNYFPGLRSVLNFGLPQPRRCYRERFLWNPCEKQSEMKWTLIKNAMEAYNLSSPLHELVSCWQQAIHKEIVLCSERLNAGLRNWSRSDDGIDEQESVSLRAGPCVCSMKNAVKPRNFNSLHHRLYELVSRLPQVIHGILLCSERLIGWLGKKKHQNKCM